MVGGPRRGYGRADIEREERPDMKRRPLTALAAAGATLALAAAGASAAAMHATLGAHLTGMGDHGVVNLQITSSSSKLCWTFDVPTGMGATVASIHAGENGMTLLELGMHYTAKGCTTEPKMDLEHLETSPATYWVWVNTKAHMGDLRGKLSAGMAAM
jgi:hypothetical protein